MSIRNVSLAEHAVGTDYVVLAPHAGEVLSLALRAAYTAQEASQDQFADLLCQLERIEIVPRRTC